VKLLVLFLVFLISCSTTPERKNVKLKLRVLHTNDHHGHYLPDRDGQYGMAARKTLIDKLRTEIVSDKKGAHLLLSGGDINTGTMESDIFDAEPDFLGMKFIGYDAMAVGNHEFDNSYEVILKQKKWASFPFLSANIFWKKNKKRVFEPAYLVKNFHGVKVGIFGLTTVDTPFKASHDDAKKKFEFRSIIKSAKEIVGVLKKKEKVDLIIAVTHVGHHGSATSNGDIDLAQKVDGIDVIVGGHSQEIINAQEHNGTLIVQAEDWGKYVGVLDLYVNQSHQRVDFEYELKPVNLKKKTPKGKVYVDRKILEDATLKSFFSTYAFKAEKIGQKVVGEITHTLDGSRSKVRSQQMAIGQFMGESLRHQVSGVDGVVLNGGSMRASLNAGKVSRKDLHNVHPYGNTIAVVKLSSEEFFKYLKNVSKFAIVDPQNIIGGYPHFVNMKLYFKDKKLYKVTAYDGSWKIENKGNKIASTKKEFTLGTMNFLAKGGDNYPKLTGNKRYVDTGFMINSAMMNYVEHFKKVKVKPLREKTSNIINGL
jgi:5'-nucleotidase/UDP-sugar diphosphatase